MVQGVFTVSTTCFGPYIGHHQVSILTYQETIQYIWCTSKSRCKFFTTLIFRFQVFCIVTASSVVVDCLHSQGALFPWRIMGSLSVPLSETIQQTWKKMWFLKGFAHIQLSKYCLNLKLNFKILIHLFNFKTGWIRYHCHGRQTDLRICEHQKNAV